MAPGVITPRGPLATAMANQSSEISTVQQTLPELQNHILTPSNMTTTFNHKTSESFANHNNKTSHSNHGSPANSSLSNTLNDTHINNNNTGRSSTPNNPNEPLQKIAIKKEANSDGNHVYNNRTQTENRGNGQAGSFFASIQNKNDRQTQCTASNVLPNQSLFSSGSVNNTSNFNISTQGTNTPDIGGFTSQFQVQPTKNNAVQDNNRITPSTNNNTNSYQSQKNTSSSESVGIWVKSAIDGQKLSPSLDVYLNMIEAYLMPLRPNRDALISIYCESIHPILPILDKDQFIKLHSMGQAPTLLLHAVLLVAARHPDAAPYLAGTPVRDFCSQTAEKIRALLFAEVEQDRLTLVRVYALLSLHSEGPDGLENSCSDLQKSIHYAISLGLHHNKPFVDQDELRNVWWSIWCLDRISACVNARPLIINLEDVSCKYTTPEQHPTLAKLIDSCKTLERVIYLYRPNPILHRNFSIFGERNEFSPVEVSDPISAVFALMHYTAIVLAHKRSTDESRLQDRSPPDHRHILQGNNVSQDKSGRFGSGSPLDPDSTSMSSSEYTTSVLLKATSHILTILKKYSNVLPPLPLIPYCASLTLTIFLRTYPAVDPSGYTWLDSSEMLLSMSDRWWVAAAMGKMGQTVFRRIESQSNNKSNNNTNNNNGSGTRHKPSSVQNNNNISYNTLQHNGAQMSDNSLNGHFNNTFQNTISSNISNNSNTNKLNNSGSNINNNNIRNSNNSNPKTNNNNNNGNNNSSNQNLNGNDYLKLAAGNYDLTMLGNDNEDLNFSSSFDLPVSTQSNQNTPKPEDQYTPGSTTNTDTNPGDWALEMFSQLPNPTSFLDQALNTDYYDDSDVNQWFQDSS